MCGIKKPGGCGGFSFLISHHDDNDDSFDGDGNEFMITLAREKKNNT